MRFAFICLKKRVSLHELKMLKLAIGVAVVSSVEESLCVHTHTSGFKANKHVFDSSSRMDVE